MTRSKHGADLSVWPGLVAYILVLGVEVGFTLALSSDLIDLVCVVVRRHSFHLLLIFEASGRMTVHRTRYV